MPSLRCSLYTFLEDGPIRWSKKVWRRDTQFGHKGYRCLCLTSVIPKEHPVQAGFQQPVGQMIDPVGTSQYLSPAPQCLCCDPINSMAKEARSLCVGPKYGPTFEGPPVNLLTNAAKGFLAEPETHVDSLI